MLRQARVNCCSINCIFNMQSDQIIFAAKVAHIFEPFWPSNLKAQLLRVRVRSLATADFCLFQFQNWPFYLFLVTLQASAVHYVLQYYGRNNVVKTFCPWQNIAEEQVLLGKDGSRRLGRQYSCKNCWLTRLRRRNWSDLTLDKQLSFRRLCFAKKIGSFMK